MIQLEEISHSYPARGQNQKIRVLEHVSFQVKEREILVLTGAVGSGKSTLLKLMAGLISPTEGVLRRRAGVRVGMTFQRGGLFDSMTCAENVRFPLIERLRLPREQIETHVQQALKDVGLSGAGSLMVSEMSGGMQKRLGIARALALKPQLVFYDEPAAGLDPVTARAIWELIFANHEKEKMTVVIAVSDPSAVLGHASRLAFLHGKTLRAIGSVAELRAQGNPMLEPFLRGVP